MGAIYARIPTSIWRDPEFTSLTATEQLEWFRMVCKRSLRRPAVDPEQRRRIYLRDGDACLRCDARDDLTLDHIYPWSLGGSNDDDNLQTLCRPCNSRKGARY